MKAPKKLFYKLVQIFETGFFHANRIFSFYVDLKISFFSAAENFKKRSPEKFKGIAVRS